MDYGVIHMLSMFSELGKKAENKWETEILAKSGSRLLQGNIYWDLLDYLCHNDLLSNYNTILSSSFSLSGSDIYVDNGNGCNVGCNNPVYSVIAESNWGENHPKLIYLRFCRTLNIIVSVIIIITICTLSFSFFLWSFQQQIHFVISTHWR